MIGEKMKANWGIEGTNLVAENPCIEIAKEKESGSQRVLAAALPNPEVPAKASRRRFTAEYKLRILMLADACTEAGSVVSHKRRVLFVFVLRERGNVQPG